MVESVPGTPKPSLQDVTDKVKARNGSAETVRSNDKQTQVIMTQKELIRDNNSVFATAICRLTLGKFSIRSFEYLIVNPSWSLELKNIWIFFIVASFFFLIFNSLIVENSGFKIINLL